MPIMSSEERILAAISLIENEYLSVTTNMYDKAYSFNQKKVTICDLVEYNYNCIAKYVNGLDIVHFSKKFGETIDRFRIKASSSIESKLQRYKDKEDGKIPFNKCLNDLFGLRIILQNSITFDEIKTLLKENGITHKCIDSTKNGYKATHIYFKKDNNSFQWELQIWNKVDEVQNISSHKNFRQEYTHWEEDSKKD